MSAPAATADVLELEVRRSGQTFDISFEVLLDAPPARVQRLLEDPLRWTELSRVIVSTEFLGDEAGPGRPVSVVFHDCILFLCMEVNKVSAYRFDAGSGGTMIGTSVAGHGDFRSAREVWRLSPDGRGTLLSFSAELEPDFRVPRIIGPFLLKGMLRTLLREMESNIEDMEDQ